jgi:hypothetical protein
VRAEVRLEAENFHRLENFSAERRNDRTASHRVSVTLSGAKEGSIRTTFNQPYAATDGKFEVEVRYAGGKQGRSEYRLFVGGVQQGEAWTASADSDGWQSKTIPGVSIKTGDEIRVAVRAEGGESGRLDYVQFNAAGGTKATGGGRP